MNMFASLPAWAGRAARPLILASVLAVGAFAAHPAVAQDTTAADTSPYTLKKRVFKSGDISRYKLDVKNHVSDMDIVISMLFKETVQAAKPNGEFTLLNEFESAVANLGGAEQDISAFLPKITVIRDKDGKLTNKTEGGNEQANAQISTMLQQMSTMQEAFLPKTAVKVGDKWKVSVSTPGPTGGTTKSDGEATLVGTEMVAGIKSLKLKVISDVDNRTADVKAHSESMINIDADSGKLLKMSATVDGTAAGMKMNQQLDISLVPAEKKADAPAKK